MIDERFSKQLQFILELDKEKNIYRQTSLTNHGRKENDAEHAWHMAIMIYLLKEYANDDFDVKKAMLMALIHDVVEIDAGDAYAYDQAALDAQEEKEKAAAKRLFGMLPKDQQKELADIFEEFEKGESAEARFVRTIDNLQPLVLNNSNGGTDWMEHGVSKAQVYKRQQRNEKGSQFLWEYTKELIEENAKKGSLK